MASPNSLPLPAVSIEYDARGKRTTKSFDDAYKARSFYAQKMKEGKQPAVVAGTLEEQPEQATDATTKREATGDSKPTRRPGKKTALADKQEETSTGTGNGQPKDATPTVPGVNLAHKGRNFYAGQLYAKHGLEAGVTDALVAELDKLVGKNNPVQSRFDLAASHAALRGFFAAKG